MTNFKHILAIFIAGALIFGILVLSCSSTMRRVEWQEETYFVRGGDTLWGIAEEHCPNNVDLRDWIKEVKELNGLESSMIYAGQRLTILVPVE